MFDLYKFKFYCTELKQNARLLPTLKIDSYRDMEQRSVTSFSVDVRS